MKKYCPFILSVVIMISACNRQQTQTKDEQPQEEVTKMQENIDETTAYYGKQIDNAGAITVAEMMQMMGDKREYIAKIKGEVKSVCQKKGCWMTIAKDNNTDITLTGDHPLGVIRVTFKDYGFFVPMDISGKIVVMKGFAYLDTVSVDMLRHFAEDEGKPEEEILHITKPEINLAFEAEGVIIL